MSGVAKHLMEATVEALRDGKFVDPDDDCMPTFVEDSDLMGNPTDSRIDVWLPSEQAAAWAAEAVLRWLGRTRMQWLPGELFDLADEIERGRDS